MSLTDSKLKGMLGKAHDGARAKRVADRDGLSAMWSSVGGLTWVFRYRLAGKQRELKLGNYTGKSDGLSLGDARARAEKLRGWLAEGKDPAIQQQLERETNLAPVTVRDAVLYWFNNYANENRKNAVKTLGQFEKWIFPGLGHLPLAAVETRHWLECFDKYGKAAPVASGYCLQAAKQALRYCRRRNYAHSSALDDVLVADVGRKQKAKDRVLSEQEFKELLLWINRGGPQQYYRDLVWLLVSFGCRSAEARLSTLDEWDLDNGLWTVPKENSKTGTKIQRPIPQRLKPWLNELIATARRNGSSHILGELKTPEAVSQNGRTFAKRLGHREPWALHDLRRTFTTYLNDMGIAPYIVEQLLGHTLGGVMAIYNRSQHLPEKLKALEAWQDRLAVLMADCNNVVWMNKEVV